MTKNEKVVEEEESVEESVEEDEEDDDDDGDDYEPTMADLYTGKYVSSFA